jgi:hypothetical protein
MRKLADLVRGQLSIVLSFSRRSAARTLAQMVHSVDITPAIWAAFPQYNLGNRNNMEVRLAVMKGVQYPVLVVLASHPQIVNHFGSNPTSVFALAFITALASALAFRQTVTMNTTLVKRVFVRNRLLRLYATGKVRISTVAQAAFVLFIIKTEMRDLQVRQVNALDLYNATQPFHPILATLAAAGASLGDPLMLTTELGNLEADAQIQAIKHNASLLLTMYRLLLGSAPVGSTREARTERANGLVAAEMQGGGAAGAAQ